MKSFYICNACFHFTRKNEDHYIGVLGKTRCAGELKLCFNADNIVKEIKKLIEPKFHDDSDKLREHKNKLNNVLQNLIEQLTLKEGD